jgi:hypothetical protein
MCSRFWRARPGNYGVRLEDSVEAGYRRVLLYSEDLDFEEARR